MNRTVHASTYNESKVIINLTKSRHTDSCSSDNHESVR